MQRTSVDLPEPESPMMTKISPARIANEASRTAPISPAAASCAAAGRRSCSTSQRSAPGPNSFQTPSQASLTSVIRQALTAILTRSRAMQSQGTAFSMSLEGKVAPVAGATRGAGAASRSR